MAAPFYNQTTLFNNQIVSPLPLFQVNRASEHNFIAATKQGETRNLGIETRWFKV